MEVSPLNRELLAALISDRYCRKDLEKTAKGLEKDRYLFDSRSEGIRIGIFHCPAKIPFHLHIGVKFNSQEQAYCRLNLSRFQDDPGLDGRDHAVWKRKSILKAQNFCPKN